jgi:hypothetical protein
MLLQKCCWAASFLEASSSSGKENDTHTAPTRVVKEISLSRNVAKYLFRISRNNFFYFAKFHEISYREILRNFAIYREIFATKLKFSQGKLHFWILLHFNAKTTFMSKIHKHLYSMYSYPFFRERIRWSGSVPKFPGSGTLVRLSKNVD